MSTETVSLYYTAGSSDKEYHASIEPTKGGFLVNFAYGRRGSTLTTGTKTSKPVALSEAKKILDKLVKEKTAKGYTPGAAGTPYQHTDQDQRQTDVLPQLLNDIEEAEVQRLIDDDAWCAQEKYDGRRVLLRSSAEGISGINRSGLTIGLPAAVAEAARELATTPIKRIPHHFIVDGECIGEVLHVFDILSHDDVDTRSRAYAHRWGLLSAVFYDIPPAIRISPLALSRSEKQALFERLRRENREGIVFKRKTSLYVAGRPNNGGDQLKFKFVATATCMISKVNGMKRSVALRLYQDGVRIGVDVGNVTIPANHSIPAPGTIVEVRYLYAYKGGALYQPVYLGPRDDVDATACRLSQLKYKPTDGVEDC